MSDSLIKWEEEKNPDKHYRSYIPSTFILASLPLRDVKSNSFSRKMKNIELFLTGARNVPFGKYARLLLSVLTTHAVLSENQTGSVTIQYNSISQLTEEMLLPRQRSGQIKEQLDLFSMTSFQFKEKITKRVQKSLFEEFQGHEGDFEATWNSYGNIPFMKKLSYVSLKDLNKKGKDNHVIGITIELSEDFAVLCRKHSVPIDYTVYSQITSTLGKDLYAWLVYRNNALQDDEDVFIPRNAIIEQFVNSDEKGENRLIVEATGYNYVLDQIRIIKEKYYKNLKVIFEKDGSGITIEKSVPVIQEKDKRFILLTNDILI